MTTTTKIVRIFGKFDHYRNAEKNPQLYINVVPYHNTDWNSDTVSLICEVNSWKSSEDGPIHNFNNQVISTLKDHNVEIISIGRGISNSSMELTIVVDRKSFESVAIIAKTKSGYV